MSENYDAELCEEKHEKMKEKLDLDDKMLNNHSDGLDRLEQNKTENRTEIKNLIKKVVLWIQQKLVMYGYLKVGVYTEMVYDEPTFQAVTNLQKA